MKAPPGRFYRMTHTRILQVWFGILGIAAGLTVLVSGVLTADKLEASDKGITITVVQIAKK